MLLAAGLGTRLKPFTDKHPKALAEVNGKTLLQHNIEYLQQFGITDVVVNVHHFAAQIEDAVQQHQGFGSRITISDERDAVLETGGGILKAAPHFIHEKAFVVMNVDVLTRFDLRRLIAAHDTATIATLAVMQRPSSRQLLFDTEMTLCGWRNNHTAETKTSLHRADTTAFAFSGIQVVSPAIFNMPFEGKFSIIDVYLHYAKEALVKGYDHTGDVFIDVGKPESIEKASLLFQTKK